MSFIVRSILVICLIFPFSASAKTRLTEPVLNNLIESIQSLETWSEKNKHKWQQMNEVDDNIENLTSAKMISSLKRAGAYHDIASLVKQHGFDSVEQWADVLVRTMSAMMANMMSKLPDYQNQLQAQVKQLMNNPSLTKEQKQAMMQMMAQSQLMVQKANNSDPQDVADVKPYLDKLKNKIMKESDENKNENDW